jgi:hypothetical protein
VALGFGGGGVVTLLGACRTLAIVQATPIGTTIARSKITGMIAARTYAIRCGRCSGGCCGVAINVCDSCGGGHLGSTLDMRQ